MNRNRKLSKAFLFGAAAAMALSPAAAVIPAYAASPAAVAGQRGEQADISAKGTITISGIAAKDLGKVTVKAYQIVDGYYKDGKLARYVLMDPTNANINYLNPYSAHQDKGQTDGLNDLVTSDELTTIANNIQDGVFTADAAPATLTQQTNGTYTAQVEPGAYIILVSGSTDTVYNPAIVAVNVSDAMMGPDAVVNGDVNLVNFFQFNDGTSTTNAYLKSSTSTSDGRIVASTKEVKHAQEDDLDSRLTVKSSKGKGDTVAVGDTAYFQIDGITIPSYSKDYTNPQFTISDTLQEGSFDPIENLKITVNGEDVTDNEDVCLVETNDNTFDISFTESFLRAHAGDAARPAVVVTYQANLATTAGKNFAENLNHVTVRYSNDPANADSFKTMQHNTYHYTFGIDSIIDSQGTNQQRTETYEFNKVTEAGQDFVQQTRTSSGASSTMASPAALAGAGFTLYSDDQMTQVSMPEVKSDSNGHITFNGLDEGTYYLKETSAPSGYTLSDVAYKLVISAQMDDATGVLNGYSVAKAIKSVSAGILDWQDEGTDTYAATYTVNADGTVTNTKITSTLNPSEIVDTKLPILPSTGGRGTIALTVCASIGAAGCLILYLNGRKKRDTEAQA